MQSIISMIADPGVTSWIPALPHTFVEIDQKTFSNVINLHLFKKDFYWQKYVLGVLV